VIVVDASVVIAWLDGADAHHERATQLLLDNLGSDLLLHPVTLAEILVGPARTSAAELAHDTLVQAGLRPDVPDAGQPVRLARLRAETRLRLPDCCVLDVARVHGAALATFDDRLAMVAREQGVDVL
jgi:predicted nucleic acid-binding protein